MPKNNSGEISESLDRQGPDMLVPDKSVGSWHKKGLSGSEGKALQGFALCFP